MMPRCAKSFSTLKALAVHAGHGGHADVVEQQRVAVRRGAHHLIMPIGRLPAPAVLSTTMVTPPGKLRSASTG